MIVKLNELNCDMKKSKIIISIVIAMFAIVSYCYCAESPDVLLEKGKLALYKNNYQAALPYFNETIELDSDNFEAYYYRGLTYLYLSELEKAIEDFTASIKYNPDFPDSYNNRGLAYNYLEKFHEALSDFTQAIKLDPQFAEAYMNRGSFYLYTEDFVNARKDFELAAKYNSTNPELYFLRGRLNYTEGKYKDAINDFTQAIKLGLNSQKVYYNRANGYVHEEEFSKAIEDYSKVLEIDPNDLNSLNNRAYCYDKLGEDELAKQDKARHQEIIDMLYPKPDFGNMKKVSDPNNKVSLEIPDSWHIWFNRDSNNINLLISQDKIDPYSDPLVIGATGGLVSNLPEDVLSGGVEGLVQFWEQSRISIAQRFAVYEYRQKKSMRIKGNDAIENIVRAKHKEGDIAFIMLEFAVITNNQIFFLILQSPEDAYYQFEDVFQKIIRSVEVNYSNEEKR